MIPIFDVEPELAGMQALVAVALADYAAARDAEPQRAAVGPLRTVLACAREIARHAPLHHDLWQQAMDVTQMVQTEARQAQVGHPPGSMPANAYLRVRLAAQGLRVQIVDRTQRLRTQEYERRYRKVHSPKEHQEFARWRETNGYPEPEWTWETARMVPLVGDGGRSSTGARKDGSALAWDDAEEQDAEMGAEATDDGEIAADVSEDAATASTPSDYQAAITRKQPPNKPASGAQRAMHQLDQLQDAYRRVYGVDG